MTRQMIRMSLAGTIVLALAGPAAAQMLDPAAISITMPDDIQWVAFENGGSERAVLYGNEAEPGPYGFFIKWKAGNHFSMPHSHSNDRYIIVVSGTWWVGTGRDFAPETKTVPLGPGTFVIHHAGEVHYDGARDEDAVLLIQGQGPATSTPAN